MVDLKQATAEQIQEVFNWVNQAKDFVVEQAPLLASEIVSYGIWGNMAEISAALCLILTIVLFARKGISLIRANNSIDPAEQTGFSIGIIAASSALTAIIALTTLNVAIVPLIKALVAPRLYVLQILEQML